MLALLAAPALAQQEPPARVGRVALVVGNIAFHMVGETAWSAGGLNYPVATGGAFWTDAQSRAQLHIGPTTIGMAGGTELDVASLNEQATQLQVPQGRVWLHIRELGEGESVEIDIPQGAARLLQPGEYAIDAGGDGRPGHLAVYAGSARFVSGGTVVGVDAGALALLSGFNPVTARIDRVAPDAFVAWCRASDYREDRLAAPRYISPDMTGYAELDQYGSWESAPGYGAVWYPSAMPAGWAPYRFGRWVWIAPWGWTWVDREPWGFAPFHYGRWASIHGRWGWVPGRFVRHPVYAPALVAFIGAVGVSTRVGPTVGWFPLAPGEAYWPSYTRNPSYIRQINSASAPNVPITRSGAPPPQIAKAPFANRQHATVVPRQVFVEARPVAPAAVPVPAAALQRAPVTLHPPRVGPAATRTVPHPGPAAGPAHRPGPAGVTVLPPHPGSANQLRPAPAPGRPAAVPQLRPPRMPSGPPPMAPPHTGTAGARPQPAPRPGAGPPVHPPLPPALRSAPPGHAPSGPSGPQRFQPPRHSRNLPPAAQRLPPHAPPHTAPQARQPVGRLPSPPPGTSPPRHAGRAPAAGQPAAGIPRPPPPPHTEPGRGTAKPAPHPASDRERRSDHGG